MSRGRTIAKYISTVGEIFVSILMHLAVAELSA